MVTDILQWIKSYATLASVLASAYPKKIAELMVIIAKCHREFNDPAWIIYNHTFWRHPGTSTGQ